MYRRIDGVSEAFRDLIFKVSLLENDGSLKEALTDCFKNKIADVNRQRIQSAAASFALVLQDVVSSFATQMDSGSVDPGSYSGVRSEASQSSSAVDCMAADSPVATPQSPKQEIDPRFIQITANKSEIDRRIAAFVEHQRIKVNLTNVQEFCGVEQNSDDSCARVDAVFVPRTGTRSHILVRKVVNQCGPQTRGHMTGYSLDSATVPMLDARGRCADKPVGLNCALEERLSNMETHLQIYLGQPVPKDIYKRLQELENRLLYLESISPEYFMQFPVRKRFRPDCYSSQIPAEITNRGFPLQSDSRNFRHPNVER